MDTRHKYVRHSTLGVILWPANDVLWHSHVGRLALENAGGGAIISAGFVNFYGADGLECYGKSDSLRIGSLPRLHEAGCRCATGVV
jgi:hypothetical protein